jgi:UDP-glucose 4-epimerase
MTVERTDSPDASSSSLAARPGTGLRQPVARGRSIAISSASNSALGRGLVAQLAEAAYVSRIVVLDTVHPGPVGSKISFYAMDLTQPGVDARLFEVLQAEQVDTFVHLSAVDNPIHATAWAHELERSGTMQVLHACHKRKISRLIVVSSALCYGPHRDNPNFLREEQPLRGLHGCAFVADKLDVEAQVEKWRHDHADCVVSVLRMAIPLGPNIANYATRFFARAFVPSVLGYDPLVQFVHESDALLALQLALQNAVPGVFNIASEGVLRLSAAIRVAGRLPLPLPYGTLRRLTASLWAFKLCEAPAPFVALLRHLCVVDCARAEAQLGFRARFNVRDALLELRTAALPDAVPDAKLLSGAR